jgi:hypothetical protein
MEDITDPFKALMTTADKIQAIILGYNDAHTPDPATGAPRASGETSKSATLAEPRAGDKEKMATTALDIQHPDEPRTPETESATREESTQSSTERRITAED